MFCGEILGDNVNSFFMKPLDTKYSSRKMQTKKSSSVTNGRIAKSCLVSTNLMKQKQKMTVENLST